MRQVYLDHQSATPVLPEALEAMRRFLRRLMGILPRCTGMACSPATPWPGPLANRRLHPRRIAGGNHLYFRRHGIQQPGRQGRRRRLSAGRQPLVISPTEHPAVIASVEFLEARGFACTLVPVDAEGVIDPSGRSRRHH